MTSKKLAEKLHEVLADPIEPRSVGQTVPTESLISAAAPAFTLEYCIKVITDHWSKDLHVAQVDADLDFFAMGGDSIMLVQSLSKIGKTIGITVPLTKVLDVSSVTARKISELLLTEAEGNGGASLEQ